MSPDCTSIFVSLTSAPLTDSKSHYLCSSIRVPCCAQLPSSHSGTAASPVPPLSVPVPCYLSWGTYRADMHMEVEGIRCYVNSVFGVHFYLTLMTLNSMAQP